jgi:hypothetical protein
MKADIKDGGIRILAETQEEQDRLGEFLLSPGKVFVNGVGCGVWSDAPAPLRNIFFFKYQHHTFLEGVLIWFRILWVRIKWWTTR